MRKPAFCTSENKAADELHRNLAADQRLCFHCIDCTIPLLPKSQSSSYLVVNPVCVKPVKKTLRQVFLLHNSNKKVNGKLRIRKQRFFLSNTTVSKYMYENQRTNGRGGGGGGGGGGLGGGRGGGVRSEGGGSGWGVRVDVNGEVKLL